MTEVTCSNCFTQTNVEESAKYPVIPSSWVRLRMDFDRGILTDTVICGDCVKVVREALAQRKEGFVSSSVAETDAAYSEHEADVDAIKEAEAQAELERQADQARFEAQQAENQETVLDSPPVQPESTVDQDAKPVDAEVAAAPQPMSNRAKKRAQAAVAKAEGGSSENASDVASQS